MRSFKVAVVQTIGRPFDPSVHKLLYELNLTSSKKALLWKRPSEGFYLASSFLDLPKLKSLQALDLRLLPVLVNLPHFQQPKVYCSMIRILISVDESVAIICCKSILGKCIHSTHFVVRKHKNWIYYF